MEHYPKFLRFFLLWHLPIQILCYVHQIAVLFRYQYFLALHKYRLKNRVNSTITFIIKTVYWFDTKYRMLGFTALNLNQGDLHFFMHSKKGACSHGINNEWMFVFQKSRKSLIRAKESEKRRSSLLTLKKILLFMMISFNCKKQHICRISLHFVKLNFRNNILMRWIDLMNRRWANDSS